MLTPVPFDMGLVMMGNNPVATDAVGSHIAGLDPREIGHIRLAHEKGFGPIDLGEITLDGDVTLEQARAAATGFRVGLVRVEQYFTGTRITAHAGPPPEQVRGEYCWGGCPGAIEEAIEVVRRIDRNADQKMRPMTVVFGGYQGPIEAKPDDKVIFIGDCARWEGKICGEPLRIENEYGARTMKDPHHATSEGIFVMMAKVYWNP
jgi:hypothetical protein